MRWPGIEREAETNFRTHLWAGPPDFRCFVCDCRPGHAAASWPCGVEPSSMLSVRYDRIDDLAEADETGLWEER